MRSQAQRDATAKAARVSAQRRKAAAEQRAAAERARALRYGKRLTERQQEAAELLRRCGVLNRRRIRQHGFTLATFDALVRAGEARLETVSPNAWVYREIERAD